MKILPLAAEPSHAGEMMDGRTNGQTNMTKVIVYFRNIANAPKTSHYHGHIDSKSDHKHGTLWHILSVQLFRLWK